MTDDDRMTKIVRTSEKFCRLSVAACIADAAGATLATATRLLGARRPQHGDIDFLLPAVSSPHPSPTPPPFLGLAR